MSKPKKDLVQIIKDNPGCTAIIDNDCWWLVKAGAQPFDHAEDDVLAQDGEVIPLGSGYGSGCRYGGDILQALAAIVGISIESV